MSDGIVAVVSGTTGPERVLFEAARRADDSGATVYVLYVLGVEWYASTELWLAERLRIPTGADTIRTICERKADRLAAPTLERYEAAGRIGHPIAEIVEYATEVGADTVVVDGDLRSGTGAWRRASDPLEAFREQGLSVVPVY
ncbi:universal stress protein [Natronococcus sp. A-GB7]|uniref:universal stress protein n=1 Tax=Natronococcus sp. A-GB7 TaxID=3037649 RepID=UPI00241EF501|nr:universal stress protein [Natronococcus sp. A-GB7]MDG5818636.1 universal stress protein [Natronococcus sp. A-GB7]